MNKTSARILAVGLPLAAVAATGAAFAFYTSGSSTTTSGDAAAGVDPIVLTAPAIDGLVPGKEISVDVQAENPNATTSVGVSTLEATVTSDDADCNAVSGATAVATPLDVVIEPGDTVTVGSVKVTMANDPDTNQDACKGKTFTVTLTAA